ncbi:MAG: tetratricopeptide repeat protein [Aestuariivita sp.]|nr:tetratricopeptide repeat protein [Aestuariivita sp.]MCY4203494.1 tetratricopeptide repeat protein [Aestuariivita sp.]
MRTSLAFLLLCLITATAHASDPPNTGTLADIRQELNVLYVEIQRLKRELSTTGPPPAQAGGNRLFDRLDALEARLRALTANTEELNFRVEQIIRDGTNRIGDLEFRLVELEGGDVSTLPETTTLGGEDVLRRNTSEAQPPSSELAIAEQADFDAAITALDTGEFAEAVLLLNSFVETYPGSPLSAEAYLRKGLALKEMNNMRDAAQAFLQSYKLSASGPFSAEAVLELGVALGELGNIREACATLEQVIVRFESSEMVPRAQSQIDILSCL